MKWLLCLDKKSYLARRSVRLQEMCSMFAETLLFPLSRVEEEAWIRPDCKKNISSEDFKKYTFHYCVYSLKWSISSYWVFRNTA